MNRALISAAVCVLLAGCSGCSLNRQVPKAVISFNPVTHEIHIDSHKDVELKDVEITFSGTTNVIRIGSYKAQANIAVIQAAVEAQQQQIAGIQDGLSKVLAAAAKGATP